MKKVVSGIIGCGLLAGVVVYFISKKGNKQHNEANTNKECTPLNGEDRKSGDVLENIESVDIDIKASREKAASSISERHKEAAKIVNKSMGAIFNEDEKTGMHANELSDISNELDELLKENN